MMKIVVLLLLTVNSLFFPVRVHSQDLFSSANYPQGYFRNPLNIPISLVANFGELRSNHFHMGFDIRTDHRENLPVYAAAEGYVSRIKIERLGFGRAIYITHPNGYTTLYAHLNDFYPALNNFIKDKQYTDQQWEQEIEFRPDQFPVAKGQFIAYSGSTGGSEGPHLHFEIRDTKTGNNLNPWLFGFGLADRIPPSIYRLYYYDRRYSTYKTSPVSIPIAGSNGKYSAFNKVVVLPTPYVSFGISADDKTSASSARYGIYEASLLVDGIVRSAFQLNNISYDDTRYENACIDYKTKLSGGSFIQHLSRLPGNLSTIFLKNDNGKILTDTLIHTVEIVVKDANGNVSNLHFRFKYDPSKWRDYAFAANSISFVQNKKNAVKTDDIEVTFSAKAFYDTVPFVLRSEISKDKKVVSAVHYLNNLKIPVHDSFTVRIKPVVSFPENIRDRIIMQLTANHKVDAVKGKWKNNWMEAKFRDFGMVKLVTDTIPARITLSGWTNGTNVKNRKSISLSVTDDAGEIKSFKALEDGKWLMFSRKNNLFIHTFDERTLPGKHQLKVTVEDIAGNITEKTYSFIR